MKIDPYNSADILKYFKDTFVQFKEEGNALFYVLNCDTKYLYVQEVATREFAVINLNKGYNIDFCLPRKCVFLHKDRVSMIARIPAQQWKKGIHSKNTAFYQIVNGEWESVMFLTPLLVSYLNTKYNTMNDYDGMRSLALSPRVSIAHNGNVFIDMIKVGVYDLRTHIFKGYAMIWDDIKKYFPLAQLEELE